MADERKSIANPTADEIRDAANELNFNMDKMSLIPMKGLWAALQIMLDLWMRSMNK